MVKIDFGIVVADPPPSESVRQGILAEKNGFDSVWVPDHLVDFNGCRVDPWTTLAAIGVQTKHIFLCPGVTDTQRCHPAKLAQIVASLDELTKGRAGLGIGAGEAMNTLPFGIEWEKPSDRAGRLREAIQVIKLLWSSKRSSAVRYKGKFYSLHEAWLDQSPAQKHRPEIYVGALASSRTLKIVGELGDGWFSWINTPETFKKRLGYVKVNARKAGRNPEKVDSVVWLYIAISNDRDVLKKATSLGKLLLFGERTVLKSLGYELPRLPIKKPTDFQNVLVSEKTLKLLTEACEEIPDDIVNKCMAIGSIDKCIEMIDKFIRVGAGQIAIRDLGPQIDDTLKQFNEKIIPYFREPS